MTAVKPVKQQLKDDRRLVVREASVQDAAAILEHVEHICGESDFLTMGPGDFQLTIEQEEAYLRNYQLRIPSHHRTDGQCQQGAGSGGKDRRRASENPASGWLR